MPFELKKKTTKARRAQRYTENIVFAFVPFVVKKTTKALRTLRNTKKSILSELPYNLCLRGRKRGFPEKKSLYSLKY